VAGNDGGGRYLDVSQLIAADRRGARWTDSMTATLEKLEALSRD
jgi:hypothetical protein